MLKKKILVIRFSSFGDIIQSLSSIDLLKEMYPESEIHFLTKQDFSAIVSLHPSVDKIISLDKYQKIKSLLNIINDIRKVDYELVYDAHKSMRSNFITFFLYNPLMSFLCGKVTPPVIVKREKFRLKRFLLFYLKINKFPWPFKGRVSYQEPLLQLIKSRPVIKNIDLNFPKMDSKNVYLNLCQKLDKTSITIAPSATRDMKKWPLKHWFKLIEELHDHQFIILGGPSDTYLKEFEDRFGERIINLAGKLSLVESSYLVSKSNVLISADTGLMHVGDYIGIPTIALIGPTAFGFPSGENTVTLEVQMKCRPCTKDGRGKCSDSVFQKCLVDITPQMVINEVKRILGN